MKLVIDNGVKAEPEPVLKFKLIQDSGSMVLTVNTPTGADWHVVTFDEVDGKLRMRKNAFIKDALITTNDVGEILGY